MCRDANHALHISTGPGNHRCTTTTARRQSIEGDVGGLYRDALRSSSKFTSYSSVHNRDAAITVQQQTRYVVGVKTQCVHH
jgi:hypothetical protein